MARHRYKQRPDGSLEYCGVSNQAAYASNTFAVGDIPDMMKDRERRLADVNKRNAAERKQSIIDAVNRHGKPTRIGR